MRQPVIMREAERDRNKHTCNRPHEGRSSEQRNCNTSIHIAPNISESTTNDGEGGKSKEATKEPAKHDSLDVLRNGHGDLEDCEYTKRKEKRWHSTVQLRQRTPDHRAYTK